MVDVSICMFDNKIILENLNFYVLSGKWLLLKGYFGVGKIILFKILFYCWLWFKGDIFFFVDSWYVL